MLLVFLVNSFSILISAKKVPLQCACVCVLFWFFFGGGATCRSFMDVLKNKDDALLVLKKFLFSGVNPCPDQSFSRDQPIWTDLELI